LSAKGARHPLDTFLVAGEASGDQLGASLMKKLRERLVGEIRFRGVGGPAMAAEGLASLFPMDDITAMGFGPVIRKLPLILRRIRETAAAVVASPPDVLILIDSPDFNQRVARRVRRVLPDLPIVKYVSPTVWAWRPGRARKLAPLVDHVLALFPFEPDVLRKLGGPPSSYVGHPLLERIGDLRASPEEERSRRSDPPLLVVLPGSRPLEIHRLAGIFGEAIGRLAEERGPMKVVLPTLRAREEEIRAAVESWPVKPRIVVTEAEKYAAFRRARAALAASGTVTLELALAHVPMVVAYRVPLLEGMIVRAVARISSASLPNLVLGEVVVPEFLRREDCTAEKLAQALAPLLDDTPERRKQLEAFTRLDQIFSTGGEQPSGRAARVTLEVIENKRKSLVEEIRS
jgi:lipid-A-disaccharide synthase